MLLDNILKAVENGLGAALTSKDPQDPIPYRDSTFSTILNIPPGENGCIAKCLTFLFLYGVSFSEFWPGAVQVMLFSQ